MKSFIGTCVGNPFDSIDILCGTIEEASEITKGKFLGSCYIEWDIIAQMERFPNDYSYYENNDIMFFEWSLIEHFYA